MNYLYPLKMSYATRDYIWGGTRLIDEWGKKTDSDKIAETWELTVRDDAMSNIVNGELSGMTMREYIDQFGAAVVSADFDGSRFPLLIKLIDACDNLSVQVHPDDAYAAEKRGDIGKTEMWYIVDALPGACIAYGLADGVSEADFQEMIQRGDVERALKFQPVKPGECYFIPAGMVHAIGKGILIAEIQQNCDITYRIYDYNRRQKDGTLRALHVEDAINVVRKFTDGEIDAICHEASKSENEMVGCRYFNVEKLSLSDNTVELDATPASFNSLLCIEGNGTIVFNGVEYPIKKGDSYYIPAGMGAYTVSGSLELIRTQL